MESVQLGEITREIVKLHREFYGRGPIRAKTFVVNSTVVVILSGGFTTVEETMLRAGETEEVVRLRRRFQHVMRDRFVEVVERALAVKVVDYMSQISTVRETSVEIFLLDESHPPPPDQSHHVEIEIPPD